MNEIFAFIENNTYDLRSNKHFTRANLYSTQYSTESIGNLGKKFRILFPPI